MKITEKGMSLEIIDSSELITASQIEIAELNLKNVHEAYVLSLKQIELAKEALVCKSTSELDEATTTENIDRTTKEQSNKKKLSHEKEKMATDLASYKIQRKSNLPSKHMTTNTNVSPKTSLAENDACINENLDSTGGRTKKTGIESYIIRRKQKIKNNISDRNKKDSPASSKTEQEDTRRRHSITTQKQLFNGNMNDDHYKSSPNNTNDNTNLSPSETNVRIYQSYYYVICLINIYILTYIL